MPPHQPGAASTADKNTSVRSRSKPSTAQEQQRKTVFRTVLDNPLTLQWPPLPAATRRAILDELVKLIEASTTADGKSVADWRLDEHASRRGRTRGAGNGKGKAKEQDAAPQLVDSSATPSTSSLPSANSLSAHSFSKTATDGTSPSTSSKPKPPSTPPPELLSHVVVGINEVTRSLESRIRWGRWELGDRSAAPSPTTSTSSAAPESSPKGRHRRRKSSSSSSTAGPAVLPPSSARLAAPLGLADHPAYAFAQQRPPTPTRDALPPYLVEEEGGVRMLVNSEGRRLKPELIAKAANEKKGANEPKGVKGAEGKNGAKHAEQAASGTSDPSSSALLPTATNQPTPPSPAPPPPAQDPPTTPLVDLIFVCKPDINPPSLVAHLPGMVAAANGGGDALESVLSGAEEASGKVKKEVKEEEEMQLDGAEKGRGEAVEGRKRPGTRQVLLVPLDMGAEARLADVLALRRVAAIGLSSSAPGTASLISLLHSTPALQTPLRAPWLVPHLLHPLPPAKSAPAQTASSSSTYVPTTIKHLRTSAPLNPKAASVEKKRKRRERKEGEKEEKRKKRRLAEGRAGGDGDGVYMAED